MFFFLFETILYFLGISQQEKKHGILKKSSPLMWLRFLFAEVAQIPSRLKDSSFPDLVSLYSWSGLLQE